MKKRSVLSMAVIIFASASAFAGEDHCGADLKAIDAAIVKAKLSDADMATVKAARAKAGELHKAGKEEECEKTVTSAQKLLGIRDDKK